MKDGKEGEGRGIRDGVRGVRIGEAREPCQESSREWSGSDGGGSHRKGRRGGRERTGVVGSSMCIMRHYHWPKDSKLAGHLLALKISAICAFIYFNLNFVLYIELRGLKVPMLLIDGIVNES